MTTAIIHSWYISLRYLRGLARQPWWIGVTLAQPLVYLLLFTAVFRKVADIPGFTTGSYVDFFTPGIVVVTALFSGGWAGMGVINDLNAGIVDRLLVSPVRRGALIAGLAHQAIITVIQSLIVVALGIAVGASFPGGVLGVAALIVAAVLLGTAFGALSIGLALLLRKEESVVGAVQMLLLPLTFLSSVWMQRNLMPGWIQDVLDASTRSSGLRRPAARRSARARTGASSSPTAPTCSPSRSRARGLQRARTAPTSAPSEPIWSAIRSDSGRTQTSPGADAPARPGRRRPSLHETALAASSRPRGPIPVLGLVVAA